MEYIDGDLVIRPIPEIDELQFYKDEDGNVKYNEACIKCPKKCKQSYRVSKLVCSMNK